MRVTNGFLALGLATIIALAGTGAGAAPVAATDPTPAPSELPSPTADPVPVESPDPSATPATDPTPEASATPTGEPVVDPSASPDPAASADPAASPVPDASPTPTPAPSATSTTTTTAPTVDRRIKVRTIALRQRWDAYVAGADGPNAFDCSGLVRYAYNKAGVGAKLGGGRSARGMLYWGRLKGITSRHNPKIGDVVIWGNGRHAGIWIGKGYVISALNPRQDIRVTRLHALGDPFTTFIHTRI